MIITFNNSITNDVPVTYLDWPSNYVANIKETGEIYENKDFSYTASVCASIKPENEISPHELMRESGAFAFWDERKEDLYSFDDGEAL